MTVLSDEDIIKYMERKEDPLVINPFYKTLLTPNGLDISLSNKGEILTPDVGHNETVDLLKLTFKSEPLEILFGEQFILNKGQRLRVETLQKIRMPSDLTGHLYTRTKYEHRSLIGLKASGVVDAGYGGTLSITLVHDQDFSNSIRIYPLMRVAQLQFSTLSSLCELGYQDRGGSYGEKGNEMIHKAQLDPEEERRLIEEGNLEGLMEYYKSFESK